jgi:hypothetical protein
MVRTLNHHAAAGGYAGVPQDGINPNSEIKIRH